MDEGIHENCGVVAVYLPKYPKRSPEGGSLYYLYKMLMQLQNRGQLATGITTYNKDRIQLIDTYKRLGTVNDVFSVKDQESHRKLIDKYKGSSGIGHVRYATLGLEDNRYSQPFERHHGRLWKWFAFCFNGNLANYTTLRKNLEKSRYHMSLQSDTELIMHLISKEFIGPREKELRSVFSNITHKLDGAYSLAYINADGDMAVLRDPLGFRPMCYTINGDFIGAASESVALHNFAEKTIKSLKPGEIMTIKDGKAEIKRFAKSKKIANCMFEYVYFANAGSKINDKSVYLTRWNMGKELAKVEKLNLNRHDYVVVPVPDTARPAAEAYAEEVNLQCMEGLIRNRYVGRTFIESLDRAERVREKFNVNRAVVKDKKVILIEDSIVRGTTTRELIKYIKRKGAAKEVHVRVTCPPIRSPCFYGIDMSTMNELIASKYIPKHLRGNTGMEDVSGKVVEEIRREIGADSLSYLSIRGLVKAIGMENGKRELCLACITGNYPTPAGKILQNKAIEMMNKKIKARTYEICGVK